MRTTLALDDDLLEKAQSFIGLMEKTALVREALKALIQRESSRRLCPSKLRVPTRAVQLLRARADPDGKLAFCESVGVIHRATGTT